MSDDDKPAPDIAVIVPKGTNWGSNFPAVFLGNSTPYDMAVEVRLLVPPAPPPRCGDSLDDGDSGTSSYVCCQREMDHGGPHRDSICGTDIWWGPGAEPIGVN